MACGLARDGALTIPTGTRAAKRQQEEARKTICGYTDENNRCSLLHPCTSGIPDTPALSDGSGVRCGSSTGVE